LGGRVSVPCPDAGARRDLARGFGRIVDVAADDVFAAAHHADLGERALRSHAS